MNTLKKLKVVPFAAFQAFLMMLVGFLCGTLYSFGGLLIDTLVSLGLLPPDLVGTPGLSVGTLLAFGALIGMPILFALVGFATGIIEAILYNAYASRFGGIKINFIS